MEEQRFARVQLTPLNRLIEGAEVAPATNSCYTYTWIHSRLDNYPISGSETRILSGVAEGKWRRSLLQA